METILYNSCNLARGFTAIFSQPLLDNSKETAHEKDEVKATHRRIWLTAKNESREDQF